MDDATGAPLFDPNFFSMTPVYDLDHSFRLNTQMQAKKTIKSFRKIPLVALGKLTG